MLIKIENDLDCVASEVISEIFKVYYGKQCYWGSSTIVRVIPKSTVVPVGQKFEAEIFLSEYRPKIHVHKITINDKPIKLEGNVGKFEQIATEGNHKFRGELYTKNPLTNEIESRYIDFEYIGFKLQPNVKK